MKSKDKLIIILLLVVVIALLGVLFLKLNNKSAETVQLQTPQKEVEQEKPVEPVEPVTEKETNGPEEDKETGEAEEAEEEETETTEQDDLTKADKHDELDEISKTNAENWKDDPSSDPLYNLGIADEMEINYYEILNQGYTYEIVQDGGTDEYTYNFNNSDYSACIHVYPQTNLGKSVSWTGNRFGSDYFVMLYKNGLPNDVPGLYSKIFASGVDISRLYESYGITDYVEGDSSITITDGNTGEAYTIELR